MSDMDDGQAQKLDKIYDSVLEMRPVVQRTEKWLSDVASGLRKQELENARQDERLKSQKDDIDGVGKKIGDHLKGHWGWIGSAAGIAAAVVAVVVGILKILGHG